MEEERSGVGRRRRRRRSVGRRTRSGVEEGVELM